MAASSYYFRRFSYLITSCRQKKFLDGIVVDHIVVYKSKHRLQAFSEGRLVATYVIAIGKTAVKVLKNMKAT